MLGAGDLCVGDWPVEITIAGDRFELVVHGPKPRTFLTIIVTREGASIAGELPAMNAVQWADLRELMTKASESLHILRHGSPVQL